MTAESGGRAASRTKEAPQPESGEKLAKAAHGSEPAYGSKAPEFVKRWRAVHLTWQVGVFLVGVAIIIAGILMLIFPGPGWVAIFLGLAVLGTEFVWAQRVLHWSKKQAAKAAHKALDPKARRRNLLFLITGIVLIAAGGAIYLYKYGLPWTF